MCNTRRQKCNAKGSGKGAKIQEFLYRDTMNVEHDMYDYTGNNWSHWNSNKSLTKNLEAIPRKDSIDSIQKTAILETSRILQKVLQSEI